MVKRTPMIRGPRPNPVRLARGDFAPDREGYVLAVILNGDSDGTNEGILNFLLANPPAGYRGRIRKPTVNLFTKSALEAGIIEARTVAGKTVYIPLADGPPFARATPKGRRFRERVIATAGTPSGTAAPARAPSEFLSYWVPQTAKREIARAGKLAYAASNQYGQLDPGDRVYILTVWPGGQLVLLGRIVVGANVDRATAAEILETDDLWDADRYILAMEGTEEPIREIDLSDIAADLRFEGGRARLVLDHGRVIAQQLQRIRRLTRGSAALLDRRLQSARNVERKLAETTRELGQGFGDPKSNREVESRAITCVTRYYENLGWRVESRETQNLGFDLLCTRGETQLKVEVKGARATGPAFILTENELATARSDEAWLLAIVTEALSAHAQLYLVGGPDLGKYFTFKPLAYRAAPRRDPNPLLVEDAAGKP